ncbi:VirK/YbjX family protein [Mesorhizobium sp. AR02]|uniref:VirK/YbjX family protein n=1 Tax=Mesorhizobium sp. AR02 TaxID=2865837 RepID=UPI00215E9569|nr:VirK/YbjX family protein [Mesorhizobium sp. AR02]UVK51645.1 VirK/YbjX family protein [Mesorhizobium sp. AR02]
MIFETSERAWLREAAGVFSQILGLCGRLGLRQSRIFLTRFACKPVSFFKWFHFLRGFRQKHGLGCPHDDLLRKKPYKFFALGLPGHRGFDLLVDHFNLAAAGLPRHVLEAVWRGRAMDIGQVTGRRDAYALTMRLSVHSGTSHEGAFSIRLTRQSDRLDLVRLSFILYPLGASPLGAGPMGASRYTVAIGGLQGSKEPEAKRAVIEATRDLCGLRPKDAALLVMEGIAIGGGADHVLGVCDARHTINFRSPEKRAGKRADMDQYWIDRGGQQGGEFGFAMPVRSRDMAAPLSRRDVYKFEFLEFGKSLFASPFRLNEVPLDLTRGGPFAQ